MSIKTTTNTVELQQKRLALKTKEAELKKRACEGVGLSQWEAGVLINVIGEVFFSDEDLMGYGENRLRYSCIAFSEPAGKPIRDCNMKTVSLSLFTDEDEKSLPYDGKQASVMKGNESSCVLHLKQRNKAVCFRRKI